MFDLLPKYGIDLGNINAESLVTLRDTYETEVASLKVQSEKSENEEGGVLTNLTKSLEGRDDLKEAMTEFKSQVRAMFYSLIDSDSDFAIPVVEAMTELKADATNEREYWVQKVKREISPSKSSSLPDDYNERREEMEKLGELIRFAYTGLRSMIDHNDEDFVKRFPLKKAIKDGEWTGEYLPKLARLPQVHSEAVGRNAGDRFIRFTWTPESTGEEIEIPAGTLVTDVAHDYVSDFKSGYVIDANALREAVKASGAEVFAPKDEPWVVGFKTGILSGVDSRESESE